MKKKSKIFNLYNMVVVLCLVIIAGSLCVVLNRDDNLALGIKTKINGVISNIKMVTSEWFSEENTKKVEGNESNNQKVNDKNENLMDNEVNTQQKKGSQSNIVVSGTEIDEACAREIALSKFVELGETEVTADSFDVRGVLRGGEKYYLVSTEKNSLEIKLEGGEISRINNKPVN